MPCDTAIICCIINATVDLSLQCCILPVVFAKCNGEPQSSAAGRGVVLAFLGGSIDMKFTGVLILQKCFSAEHVPDSWRPARVTLIEMLRTYPTTWTMYDIV